jgi:rhamnosyltransferase subunit B
VHNPGDFYEVSVETAKRLGHRAVLIGANGKDGAGTREILALPYVPYSEVFPKAAAIVHQGGSGTTGQALRAGRPMLIVPYGWDQPDNGARVQRTGAGLCLPRTKYSAESAAEALSRLLKELSFGERATEVGAQVQDENGLVGACEAIARVLQRT